MKTAVIFIAISFMLLGVKASAESYKLTNDDVVVENGVLLSCSYNFAEKDIVIPESLDGQVITVIGKKTFERKYITSLILPKTITHIEDLAFNGNKLIVLDLSDNVNLEKIGQNAFGGSSLTKIDLSNCSSLKIIDWHAFYGNELEKINLKGCSALTTIGENAFADNHLKSLDLNSCTSLTLIKAEAFNGDMLKSFKLPEPRIEGKKFVCWKDFNGNKHKAGANVNELWNQYSAVFE